MDRANSQIGGILEEAASIVRRCTEATGNAEQTKSYKRKQIEKLKEYADSKELWIDIRNLSTGMIGFAYNSLNEFCAVLIQPYIQAKREATENEIVTYMESLSFSMDSVDEYYNNEYEIFDAVPNNVLYGVDDDLYFIDTQIRVKRQ